MDAFLTISTVIGGAAVGGALAYLWTDRRCKALLSALQTEQALAQQRAAGLADELAAQRRAAEERAAELTMQIERERTQAQRFQQQLAEAQADLSASRAQLSASQENSAAQKKLLDEAHAKLTQAFAAVSLDTLEKNNKAFIEMAESRFRTLSAEASGSLEQRKAQIATLIKPLEEMLGIYQKRLTEIEASRNDSYAALRQQIGQMQVIEQTLTRQTSSLVTALSRPSVRGQWGEIALRRLVELAGLTERCDFVEQPSVNTDEGRLRPDMIVRLPAQRSVIIDCKAVLGAFLDASAAGDEAARKTHLARHSELVRARARELSSKAYWEQFSDSPEFVVLFLPGEAFLYAAVERDAALIEDCLKDRVILATPTTLIALLKSIEYGWRQEALSQNAAAIRALGVEVYDRLAVFAQHVDKLGQSLDTATGHYNAAVKSLENRLLVSARKMGELGARNEKEIPAVKLVERRPEELVRLGEGGPGAVSQSTNDVVPVADAHAIPR